jgi:hypothetical protein
LIISLSSVYELGQAESMNKKIICLYRETENKRLSAMISGNEYMKIFKYRTLEDIDKILLDNLKN